MILLEQRNLKPTVKLLGKLFLVYLIFYKFLKEVGGSGQFVPPGRRHSSREAGTCTLF